MKTKTSSGPVAVIDGPNQQNNLASAAFPCGHYRLLSQKAINRRIMDKLGYF
jgi:hypothetical protein